jgi:hypothetical protein
MGQVLTAGKPSLSATAHSHLDVFSCRSSRTSTADAMEGEWCAGRSGAPTDSDIGQCAKMYDTPEDKA